MKQKILKLIKILNKFTIDDILSMDDFEEQEVSEILSELENLGIAAKEFICKEKSSDRQAYKVYKFMFDGLHIWWINSIILCFYDVMGEENEGFADKLF